MVSLVAITLQTVITCSLADVPPAEVLRGVETRMVNGRPMISDEQTLADQDFAQACEAFVAAEKAFNECAKKQGQPNFDVCLWWECEKRVWTLFINGDRSLRTALMYLQFRESLFTGKKLRANA